MPSLQLFDGIIKLHDPVSSQTIGSELAVECFKICVVCRLSGPGEVECDVLSASPKIHFAGDELAVVIDAGRLGIFNLLADAIQRRDDILALVAEPGMLKETRSGGQIIEI